MKPLSLNKIKAIGVMSGTSLDGMDLAAVEFQQVNETWNFSLLVAETVPYSNDWQKKLEKAPLLPGEKLMQLHAEYGKFIGMQINRFIEKTSFTPELIASHGHTVFHQPENHFTFQLGNGAEIAATTKITTVADFRSGDVALGGQGAPLVPVGDKLLFTDYNYCLNLGGFANISFEKNNQRLAFDICPVNIILNYFAEKQGLSFDKNGDLGRDGKVNSELLEALNTMSFYAHKPPKSLGREWLEKEFMPVLSNSHISEKDKLRTVYTHIAQQIAKATSGHGRMLVTGGGVFNTLLLEQISTFTQTEIVVPSNDIVNYKEALIFAFLGILRLKDINNCFASVTGAMKDSCAGIVFRT
jgi:anhydro-N-acetylmuramic acid kinase